MPPDLAACEAQRADLKDRERETNRDADRYALSIEVAQDDLVRAVTSGTKIDRAKAAAIEAAFDDAIRQNAAFVTYVEVYIAECEALITDMDPDAAAMFNGLRTSVEEIDTLRDTLSGGCREIIADAGIDC